MDTRHLVDPELIDFLANYPFVITAETLGPIREQIKRLTPLMAAPPDAPVRAVEKTVPGPAGAPDVRVLIYTPPGLTQRGLVQPLPALLHLHAGGYVLGSADASDAANSRRAAAWGCVIVSVDYRLAPETRYPGAIEDCYAALKFLHGEAQSLGVDAARIGVFGESAGGGLAAGLALLARDRGEIALCLQVLIYPMLDDRTALSPDPHPHAGEFIWQPVADHFAWSAMLGAAPGGPTVPAYAAAARAPSLAGLPPAFIAVGSLDLFVEDDIDYARRLLRAGVPAELHVYPGAYHAFDMVAASQVAQKFDADVTAAVRRALRGSG